MGVLRHRRHYCHSLSLLIAINFLLFASASAISLAQLGSTLKQERKESERASGSGSLERVWAQKRLSGPGSSPPTCRSKCGKCSPCKPVHVPIHPGMSVPLEYYPVAWRCQCGNKLFMP